MKATSQIQRAHDILTAFVLRKVKVNLDTETRLGIHSALDVLCWVLGHVHNIAFDRNLRHLEEVANKAGFVLVEEPAEGEAEDPNATELLAVFESALGDVVEMIKRGDRITLDLSPFEAWCVMANIQLACRHPQNAGQTVNAAADVARRLQALVATTPALKDMAERGWDPKYDQKP